ncbi:MAG: SDR family oxidoreductase [Limnobacter sp.]|nr:SDR family oxidoreductase [Limnobacter sp.]
MQISGKITVITGAGRGIGRALSLEFARRGASLALLDLDAAGIAETQKLCTDLGAAARTYQLNITNEEQVTATMQRIVADFGRLDVLINNAGIVKDALLVKAKDGQVTDKMSLAQWQAVIDVNLTAVFLCAREAAQHMVGFGGGVIINISSISRAGNAGQTNYTAAKAGVAAMTVVWAKELARYGIRVASIAPGFTKTDLTAAMRPEVLEKAVAPVPLKRLGAPEEIAHGAVFIVENDFFTGRSVDIDGGLRF